MDHTDYAHTYYGMGIVPTFGVKPNIPFISATSSHHIGVIPQKVKFEILAAKYWLFPLGTVKVTLKFC